MAARATSDAQEVTPSRCEEENLLGPPEPLRRADSTFPRLLEQSRVLQPPTHLEFTNV